MPEIKELESFKVIRYMIRKIQKQYAREAINILKYNGTEESMNELYRKRGKINGAYENFKK